MKYYLVLLISFLFIVSCKKEKTPPGIEFQKDGELPPATQEGKNTIGFLLDGELWLPEVHCFPCNKFNVSYGYATGTFSLNTKKLNPKNNIFQHLGIHINIRKSNPLGEYKLGGLPDPMAHFWDGEPATEYTTNYNYTGKINITRFDSMNLIYSGSFEMKVYSWKDSVVREITQGRFDIKL